MKKTLKTILLLMDKRIDNLNDLLILLKADADFTNTDSMCFKSRIDELEFMKKAIKMFYSKKK